MPKPAVLHSLDRFVENTGPSGALEHDRTRTKGSPARQPPTAGAAGAPDQPFWALVN
jgi:hypothetical protein